MCQSQNDFEARLWNAFRAMQTRFIKDTDQALSSKERAARANAAINKLTNVELIDHLSKP